MYKAVALRAFFFSREEKKKKTIFSKCRQDKLFYVKKKRFSGFGDI